MHKQRTEHQGQTNEDIRTGSYYRRRLKRVCVPIHPYSDHRLREGVRHAFHWLISESICRRNGIAHVGLHVLTGNALQPIRLITLVYGTHLLQLVLPEVRMTPEESQDILVDFAALLLDPNFVKVGFECWLHVLDIYRDLHLSARKLYSLTKRPEPLSELAIMIGLPSQEDFVSETKPQWGKEQELLDPAQYRRSGLIARAAFLGFAEASDPRKERIKNALKPRDFSLIDMPMQWVLKAIEWTRLLKVKHKEGQDVLVQVLYHISFENNSLSSRDQLLIIIFLS